MGRTGTFCAVMLCHERLLTEHMADVFDTVKTIRGQRPGMVENSVRIFHNDNQLCMYVCVIAYFRNNMSSFTKH